MEDPEETGCERTHSTRWGRHSSLRGYFSGLFSRHKYTFRSTKVPKVMNHNTVLQSYAFEKGESGRLRGMAVGQGNDRYICFFLKKVWPHKMGVDLIMGTFFSLEDTYNFDNCNYT